MKNFNEKKFYSTRFGQAILSDINNDKENLNLKSLKDFPYSNFTELKNDIKNNKAKILSFYKYKLLIGIYSGSNKKILHDFVLLIPNLILIISVVLCFILKEWIFLIAIPINFIFASKSTNSNGKSYLKFIPLLCFILSIILFYFEHKNLSILFVLILFITSSILFARKQFNDAITYFSLLNESLFCFLYKKDYIFIKTADDIYIYSSIKRAHELVEKWENNTEK